MSESAFLPLEAGDRELAGGAAGAAGRRLPGRRLPPGGGEGAHRRRPGHRGRPEGRHDARRPGLPGETLLGVVRRENADQLVVGDRGPAGIKGRLLGSVPADATRRSTIDVLVVPTTG